MRVPEEFQEEAKFQMAPMIDMVFLLLVFFMCASHLSQSRNVQLEMPVAAKGVVPRERPNRWVVNIVQDGTIYSGMDEITLDELKNEVAARVREDPELRVYLRADAQAEHREVKRVMNAMAESGVDNFIFGVYTPSGGDT